ncbi:uncharacterized protein [Hetaerina americana]|uniref:uncharacterized protein isoform X1 n=1 Tax=Hetaerina americana TaxID=62018 RepID=UPI003A7F130F
MCYTLFYLLFIFSLVFKAHAQDCETAQYEILQTSINSECYAPVSDEKRTPDCTYICDDKPNVITTVDVVKGTLIARFPLPPHDCGHTLYKVNLMINEQVHEESNCDGNVTFSDKHSIREYKINRCQNGNCVGERCEEYGEVIFNYIFSSCYKLWIEAFIKTSSRPALHSCPFFISTNFTKLKVADIQPVMVVNYDQKENVCSVDVKYHQAISKTAIELIFSENGSRVNWAEVSGKAGIGMGVALGWIVELRSELVSQRSDELLWRLKVSEGHSGKRSLNEVIIDPNSTFESMIITLVGDLNALEDDSCDRDGVDQSCCLVDSNGSICKPSPKVIEPTCNFAKDSLFEKIQCNFYNISPGNYCVRIKLTDDRCVPGTIWTANNTGCRWSHSFVTEYHPPNMQVISMPIDSTLTVFLILLGVAVAGLLILLLFWRRVPTSTTWSQAESSEEVGRPMIEGFKVLLLYPRDCQDFMNTMESFRKLLETYNIEVYDCHANDEVLNGPLYWLQKVMAYPKLCTLVVSSHCAYLQQQAILMGCDVTSDSVYKDPIFIDSIFMYGLKIIMEDVSVNSYLKNFVIGFSGFSSDEKMLTLPTRFRRYCIPEHLLKLLVDMNLELTTENIQVCNSNEFIELQNNVKSLVDYVTMKPKYLEDMLNLV